MRPVLRPPATIERRASWRSALAQWRRSARAVAAIDDRAYKDPALEWVTHCFSLCFVNAWDREWTKLGREYRVDALLDRLEKDYGGIDILMLWNGYPRLGLDTRSQFDYWRQVPGGHTALRRASDRLHKRGVRLAVPILPWDANGWDQVGSKKQDLFVRELCSLVKTVDIDAVFLDTLSTGASTLRDRVSAVKDGVAFIPEQVPDLEDLGDHVLSWMQGHREERDPALLRNKLVEQRHMHFEVRRWQSNHDRQLERAWLNGTGMVIWENVFGTWVGTDASFRRRLKLMRPVWKRYADLFARGNWEPYIDTGHSDLYGSLWSSDAASGDRVTVVTLVNRGPVSATARVGIAATLSNEVCRRSGSGVAYDLLTGETLRLLSSGAGSAAPVVNYEVAGGSFGGFLVANRAAEDDGLRGFLSSQGKRSDRSEELQDVPNVTIRRGSYSGPEPPWTIAVGVSSSGIDYLPVEVGEACRFDLEYRLRECHLVPELDSAHWLEHRQQPRHISTTYGPAAFLVSRYPVTNEQYLHFLEATGYRPAVAGGFLRHWRNGEPEASQLSHPAVNIDLDDARAFAQWVGGRLPTIEEWQLAAGGVDGRPWPWGDAGVDGRCNGNSSELMPVDAFPQAASPCGCLDLVGNAWELTDNSYEDGHTDFVLLKGGSHYSPKGSDWYILGGPKQIGWVEKMLRIGPELDRSPTVCFRVVRNQ